MDKYNLVIEVVLNWHISFLMIKWPRANDLSLRFVREISTKTDAVKIAVYLDVFKCPRFSLIESQVSASRFNVSHCQVSSILEVEFRERDVTCDVAKCYFRPSIFLWAAHDGKRCVTVTRNIHTSTRADEFPRKSHVNDLVCSARMCNKIELAIDPGGNARQPGKKKTTGRMRYLSDGAIVTSGRRDN